MADKAQIHAHTLSNRRVTYRTNSMDITLDELREIVAAAANLSGKSTIKVAGFWGDGDDRYFKQMTITEDSLLSRGIVDVQVVS